MLSLRKIYFQTFVIAGGLLLLSMAAGGVELSPSLGKLVSRTDIGTNDSLVSVVLFANDNAMGSKLRGVAALPNISLQKRHKEVIKTLQSNQAGLLENLKKSILMIYPSAEITEYWIAPALAFKIPLSKLEEVSRIAGVASIIEDAAVDFIEPVEMMPVAAKVQTVSSHLSNLNIPTLWNRGLKGRGRLICSFDTGVEGSHPALESKWRGNHVSRTAAWFAPSITDTLPVDNGGHGTHTMGIMLGSTATDSFGVAPEAEWISAAVIDQGQSLNKTFSDILAAFQWAVDPDGNPNTVSDVPDVILNSWGVPTSILPACDETFYQAIDNVEAAGVVTVFAAGNEGPTAMTLRLPANRATTPLNSFAVGAIDDATNIIASFSSRGPSSCDTNQIKPEVVAPGVSIYSSYKGGTYRLMSGTSMAAPFIAGMVALMRQYNPDATVMEIKNALIQSARDLGTSGEDNNYGYGLPDAAKAIQFLPVPANPTVYIAAQVIGGDGIADPGETFDLYIRLNIPAGNVESLTGTLLCSDSAVTINNKIADFTFESEATYSINTTPYVISFDGNLINGRSIPFQVVLAYSYSESFDTLDLQIMVGRAPNGIITNHITSRMKFTVSDFGQFGLSEKSIYNVGGVGLQYEESGNLLYEAGIIVGRNSLQLSSSVRDSLGRADRSDFSPVVQLSTSYPGPDGGFDSHSEFVDTRSTIPIPITISQSVSSFDESGDDNFVIIKYYLINSSLENLTGLYFGFLTDFDLDSSGDRIGLLSDYDMLYQNTDTKAVGILPLTGWNGLMTLENSTQKITLTGQQKIDYIKQSGTEINDTSVADFMTLNSFGPFTIKPNDSVEVSLALLVGGNVSDLMAASKRALARYQASTAVIDYQSVLPERFQLGQNFPNPFNPSTAIRFDIPKISQVNLTIYNILGERIATIFDGVAQPGAHTVIWDGLDNDGHNAPSGVYFYRLKAGSTVISKKMLMIK